MPHRNAPLSETGRLRLARCVVEDGWPLRRAAERFQVSATTAKRWADRYRAEGPAAMTDRSSRPHHCPTRTPTRTERRIIKVRVLRRWGPARIAYFLTLNPATVHRVLTRYRLARLAHLDRATGRVVRRYEPDTPGDLIHVDIKKLGNIPDGGGHKIHGRASGNRHRHAHRDPDRPRTRTNQPNLGYQYLHNAVDDHSRLAYTEILPDERKESACAFLVRALAFFQAHGVGVERVMTDNGSAYRSRLFKDHLLAAGCKHIRTKPYTPRTNGKAERFIQTSLREWAYRRPYASSEQRTQAMQPWIITYNHSRPHSALGGNPPISKLNNPLGFDT